MNLLLAAGAPKSGDSHGEEKVVRGMNEFIVPVYFGGQDYCQMAQEMGCKKNYFYHLKRVKDSTKANSGKKGQPVLL